MGKTVLFLKNPSKHEKETIKFFEENIKNFWFFYYSFISNCKYAFERTVDNAVPTVQYTGSQSVYIISQW